MKSHYRVVVIGGGIVGTSVLYHLTRLGWSDIALIERAELTAGSTWHAAAGFHALNDDPNIAALQAYTINLYREIEQESGQSVGLHMPGGYSLATTPARWEFLKAEWALYQTLGIGTRLATPEEIVADCPIVDPTGLLGGLFDPHEGAVDPHGATHAFAGAAKKRGAEVILRNRVLALTPLPDGDWRLDTEHGPVTAEHVVNAAGLWARRVGRMAGIDLPVTPMQHHYLITEDLPQLLARKDEMPCVTDLEGFTYLQQERKGVLLGVYERNPRHWHTDGAEWDYGMDLIPEDIERIGEELAIGFRRFPCLENAGIRRWVNGAFTFTPDGNPLVGPVPGLNNYWTACGCMSGFSQGGAIGLVLANWIVHGDPGHDIFGMDVARYGAFASNDTYLRDMTAQFYARRFVHSPTRTRNCRRDGHSRPRPSTTCSGQRVRASASCGAWKRRSISHPARTISSRPRPRTARTPIRSSRRRRSPRRARQAGLLDRGSECTRATRCRDPGRRPGSTACSRTGCRRSDGSGSPRC